MRYLMILLTSAALGLTVQAADWQFKVKHSRTLWRDPQGTLTIRADEIEYRASGEKQVLRWRFADIQQLKLESKQVEILTYTDQKWRFGTDRLFRFKILEGSTDAQLSGFLRQNVTGVFVTAMVPQESAGPAYSVEVRHRLTGRDAQGVLEVYNERIVYRSDSKDESRVWIFQQIAGFAFPSPRELELTTDEKKFGGPTRTFRFQLKEALPEGVHDYLWVRVHGSSYYPYEKPPADRHPAEPGMDRSSLGEIEAIALATNVPVFINRGTKP